MKKVLSVFAVVVMAMGMFSCDKNSADNDPYVEISANDNDGSSSSGGSGGN